MDYIRFAIENPVKVAVAVILLLLFGVVAFIKIPVQLTPNVEPPIITVTTSWTGRSPEDIEREIIEEQEDKLKNVSNLKKMTATASVGQGSIELEFFVGTDIKQARVEVSDKLREVPEYPPETDEPVIAEGERGDSSPPIAWLILTSETQGFDAQTLGDHAEDRIKPYIERIPGVSEVRVYGGREREVHIYFDPRQIAQRGITFNQLFDALRFENTDISAGDLAEGQYDVRVRTIGQYADTLDIEKTIVAYGEGGPIRIEDIARVEETFEKRRSFVRSKGRVALALPVFRETDANVLRIKNGTDQYAGLYERIQVINNDLLPTIAKLAADEQGLDQPPQLKLEQVYDETIYIDDAIALVQNNLVLGGSLAIIVLMLFLRSPRPTVVVALAIPISVIGTFVAMAGFGRNINVISLAGLAFAVGMVVDNAIVVLENIDRHLTMGKSPMRAAYDGAREVWGAIVASTLTTLAVFLPILTIQQEAGQLFRDIALAIVAAVTLSLIVSITVIPTASSRFLKPHREHQNPLLRLGRSALGLAPVGAWLADRYTALVHRLCGRSAAAVLARLLIVGGITVASIGGAILLMPPTDYLPKGNKNLVFGFLLTPPGYNMQQARFIAERIESGIAPYWEADGYDDLEGLPPVEHPFSGQPVEDIPPLDNYFFVAFRGGLFGGSISADKNNVAPMADLLTSKWNTIPGSFAIAQQASLFGRGISGTRSIDLEVRGYDMDNVRNAASALLGELRGDYGPSSTRPQPSNFDTASPEYRVKTDRVRAADMRVDTQALGNAIRALVDGLVVGDYRQRGEMIDILAMRDPAIDTTPEELAAVPLAFQDADGRMDTAPLSSIATFERGGAPQEIRRIEELRGVTLTFTPPDGMPLELATTKVQELAASLRESGQIAPTIELNFEGSASKLVDTREALLGTWYGWTWRSLESIGLSRLVLALLVTYLLMCALFESFLYPFVILFSVPLAMVGGLLGLAITHWFIPSQLLDVLTMLGFVILIGIVVNNAILIVHQALNFMRGQGEGEGDQREALAPREAIAESVKSRIRPIFMTTTTSVCGMAPLVIMGGAGSELYKGLGSVVIGGLIVSTVFTLMVVPLMMSLAMDVQQLMGQRVDTTAAGSLDEASDRTAEPATDSPEPAASPA